tara:strand:+ start:954 stop:1253 length:300 start_codon:yes stop_codon:yes gene_type:complete
MRQVLQKDKEARIRLMDRVRMVDMKHTALATFAIVDKLQGEPGEIQAVAVTCAFLLMADRLGVPPNDLFGIASQIMEDADGRRPEFKGAAQFFKEELGK